MIVPDDELQHKPVEATTLELKQQESKRESAPYVALAKAALVFLSFTLFSKALCYLVKCFGGGLYF